MAFYLPAAALLAAYGATLVLRRPGQFWPLLDNWILDAFEVLVALACLVGAFRRHSKRGPALALGLGLLGWALGDVIWTFESIGGASPPTPSLADPFYLALYPLAYLAVMWLIRAHKGRSQSSVWLDGAIAGLGAAAICAAFGFDTILKSTGGSPAAVAVNLSYPIGDLILLALAVAAVVIIAGWPLRMLMFGAGCVAMAVGDTIYLFQSSAGTYKVGTLVDLTWPAAILIMSASVWVRVPQVHRANIERAPQFVVPGLAAAAGIVILTVGSVHRVGEVALALAGATVAVAGARVTISLRELRHLTEARHRQAVTDELTGLGNRRQLVTELEASFAPFGPDGTLSERLALLLIDLDHFKEINDSFGHPTGDELLKQIGPRLQGSVRATDVIVRLGGDEFAIILTGADVDFAHTVASRITESFARPFLMENSSLHVGASIGIALAPDHAASAAELFRCADVAMYRAKAARCSFDTYEATLDDGADRIRLMEDLHEAISRGDITVHYQPQIDPRTGQVVTVEALLRWPHPTMGLIPPDQFIPLAEESGLIRQVTSFALEHALMQCARWWSEGHRFAVSVNLSSTDLLDVELPGQIESLLDRNNLPSRALVLEVTETTVMSNLHRSKEIISRLTESGVVVSIDDFGTGFSSLAYLSELAVGELKLDRLFTSRLGVGATSSERDCAIVRSAIALGHSLGLRVVAEGVERREHFQLLAGMGCDVVQGYAIAFPRPPEDLDVDALADLWASFLSVRAGMSVGNSASRPAS